MRLIVGCKLLFQVLTLSLLLVVFGTATAFAAKEIANISALKGEVRIKSQVRQQAGKWLRVKKSGVRLFSSDEVRTLAGTADITFTDGSVVKVSEDTNFTVEESTSKKNLFGFKTSSINRNIKIMFGSLWANIRPSKGRWTSFESKSAVAGIRGTTIEVNVPKMKTSAGEAEPVAPMQFGVIAGKVEMSTLDGDTRVPLVTGTKVSITKIGEGGKNRIESMKGSIEAISGGTKITMQQSGAAIVSKENGKTKIEAPADITVPLEVAAGGVVAKLVAGNVVDVGAGTEDGSVLIGAAIESQGSIELQVDGKVASLDVGDAVSVKEGGSLTVEQGEVDVVNETGDTETLSVDETMDDVVDDTTEDEVVEETVINETLPVEEDAAASTTLP